MEIKEVLQKYRAGVITEEEAESSILGFDEMSFAKIDVSRDERNGFPEIIYGEGKTLAQIVQITQKLMKAEHVVLATRISKEKGQGLCEAFEQGIYYEEARCFVIGKKATASNGYIAVVTAGTSDIPVAEEAAITAEVFGNKVERIYDVGVAGIHRLFAHLEVLQKASVIIAIAGMEGALISVVGGLVSVPVIAVPTSVGYGTSLNGITALLGMLNSCSSGVSVVNIDNGFGAAYTASMINQKGSETLK